MRLHVSCEALRTSRQLLSLRRKGARRTNEIESELSENVRFFWTGKVPSMFVGETSSIESPASTNNQQSIQQED